MPHIEQLVVHNYRVLKEVTPDELQPMSVVLGPNGCGKSTLFDVFGFLSDSLQTNVKKAIETIGRLRELRSRGSTGPIGITIRYRESTFGGPQGDIVNCPNRMGEYEGTDKLPILPRTLSQFTMSPSVPLLQ